MFQPQATTQEGSLCDVLTQDASQCRYAGVIGLATMQTFHSRICLDAATAKADRRK